MSELTQELLKKHLDYDPETGIFTHLNGKHKGLRVGPIVPQRYRNVWLLGKNYSTSRLAFLYMTGSWPENQVDHINRIKDDDRWCNLRDVTSKENCNNRNLPKLRKNSISGYQGVSWYKRKSCWRAMGPDKQWLGYFVSLEEAIVARKLAEQRHENAKPIEQNTRDD